MGALSTALPPRSALDGATARGPAPPGQAACGSGLAVDDRHRDTPAADSSSMPPAPWTTIVRSVPSAATTWANVSTRSGRDTPITCVGTRRRGSSAGRAGSSRSARRARGAPGPRSASRDGGSGRTGSRSRPRRSASATASCGRSMTTPSASSTSAEPAFEVIARLPCFATPWPQAATTIAAGGRDVERVRAVAAGADDVDQVGALRRHGTTCSRSDGDAAGDLVPPSRPWSAARPGSRPPRRAFASPRMMTPIAARAPSKPRSSRPTSSSRYAFMRVSSRKFRRRRGPRGVRIALGVELHAVRGRVAVPHRHHLAVGGARGQHELVGQRLDGGQRVVAARLELARPSPASTGSSPTTCTVPALPCTSRRACVTVPPYISTSSWWPRQTPRIGMRPCKRRIRSARDAGLGRPPGARRDDEVRRLQRRRPRPR